MDLGFPKTLLEYIKQSNPHFNIKHNVLNGENLKELVSLQMKNDIFYTDTDSLHVHKNNVLLHAGGLWTRTFNDVAKEFPNISTDYLHVDAASMFFVTNPERFDVVVTDNLFGDILTDIAAASTWR